MKSTIIVPLYNEAENWLDRCIESVLAQTYDDIELLLVNDGSTDGSEAICESYVENNPNVKVLNKSNGGLSSARNFGLDFATGDFVYFLDADDYIAPTTIEQCIACINNHSSDILILNTKLVAQDSPTKSDSYSISLPENVSMPSSDALKQLITNQEFRPVVWLYFYKADFLRKHNMRFEEGFIYEDNAFTYKVLTRDCEIVFLPEQLHFHWVHSASITGGKVTKKNIESLINCMNSIVRIFIELGEPKEHKALVDFYCALPMKFSVDSSVWYRDLMRTYASFFLRNPRFLSSLTFKLFIKRTLQSISNILFARRASES